MTRLYFLTVALRQTSLAVATILFASPVIAGEPVNSGYFGNLAIKGYDPVAYFVDGRPTKGKEEHTVKWLGASWQFASAEHKHLFEEAPQRYAPQFGGHCATGLAGHGGLTKEIDPEAWTIIDGKLYLNYSKEAMRIFLSKPKATEKANANWEKAKAD